MTSVLAEGVVGKVCEMAIQQAANGESMILNFREDFEWLKNRIEEINNDLNEKSTGEKKFVEWLHRVRDIAWEAEDILEERAVDSMYATNTQSCTFKCNQLMHRLQMGRRIQKIKARMRSVVEEVNQLNIDRAAVPHRKEAESSSSCQNQGSVRFSRLLTESKPVGIESKIESMVNLLENPQFPIIAVVGIGGIGKTYLLKHLYDAQKGRYEISAWLSISQFYSVSQMQRDLASYFVIDLSDQIKEGGDSEKRAAELIHSFLLGKRYLIVLDNVRSAEEDHIIARLGLPIRDNGESKILVSTRSKEVALNLNAYSYEMQYLTGEESWRLFSAYAFPAIEGNMAPRHLEEVARNIEKKCGRLPLAIKTIAASMADTMVKSKWESTLSKLQMVDTSNDNVMNILKLSYHSLPVHLKDCFLYLSFFPEDDKIECEYLIHLWKGEGFIPAGKNPWDFLDQLANLCLLEVWEEGWQEGWHLTKYCKIHDLLLHLAILISRENKCAFGVEEAFTGDLWYRLLLAKKDINEPAILERPPVSPTVVRTLSLSYNYKIGGNIPAMLISGMTVLRVFDLSHSYISTLPACVGEMKLLKVLNLRGTQIKKVPKCVRCLKSLCYLNVSECRELELSQAPKWISELRCLQHLEGPFKRMPKGITKLESLQTLRGSFFEFLSLSVDEDGLLRLEDVVNMREIEELAFKVEHGSQLKRMEEGILVRLCKLRRLKVENKVNEMRSDFPEFPEQMDALRDLEDLSLYGFAVPSWIWLGNLRCLNLWGCECSKYPELQAMPNLVSLRLSKNKSCKELPKAFGKSGGFPLLRFLFIGYFDELEEFPEMEDGAMARLEMLELSNCRKVNKVEGLERLKRLKEIDYSSSGTDELREALKADGIYWRKIKDTNPLITITGIKL